MNETWKVRMVRTAKGSPDGTRVIDYRKGQVYELPASLGRAFVEDLKCAKRLAGPRPRAAGPVAGAKALAGAPENKAAKGRSARRAKEARNG